MEKRYQVFISSTFQDLQPARQEVSQALLRADCFPAGMELFPAADEEQFAFIKQIIDQSDYYIIISAGRYGTIHPETGLSYTEMEYDYAVETGKPVIRLLHKDPFNQLKGEFIEKTDEGREQLRAFREKLSGGKLIRFWTDPSQLMAETVFGLQDIQKRRPATGWMKASHVSSNELRKENLDLRERIAQLEAKVDESLKDPFFRFEDFHIWNQLANSPKIEFLNSAREFLLKLEPMLENGYPRSDLAALVISLGYGREEAEAIVSALLIDGILDDSYPVTFSEKGDKLLRFMKLKKFIQT